MNPQMIMEMLFGKDKTLQILNKWQSMSPEQKQQELQKVQGIPRDKMKQYLTSLGIDTRIFDNINQGNVSSTERKFNY